MLINRFFLFAFFFGTSLTFAQNISDLKITVDRMNQAEDREIASKAEAELSQNFSTAKFDACVPRESVAWTEALSPDLKNRIFAKEPMKALMNCRPGDCAFNFLPVEVEKLAASKTPEEKQRLYWEFYKNRVARKTGLQENRVRFHIKSKDHLIEDCESPGLASVLDERMAKDAHFRITQIQYQSQMRPTTRLLQSRYFQTPSKTNCYAEALIFSDHYDDDRVEVWSLKKSDKGSILKVQVRHRIDILNTWYRRAQAKEGLAQELDKLLERQLKEAAACLLK
jgi:hypothetical protein